MTRVRLALANVDCPESMAHAVALAEDAVDRAGAAGADIVCFSECFVPGYRTHAKPGPAPDPEGLARAWSAVAVRAAHNAVAVVLGTERVDAGGLLISALVIDKAGTPLGFQDKNQLDPSEEGLYAAGSGRRLFSVGPLTFGIAICHEGFRYPETVRWAASRGAHVVFHPYFDEGVPGTPPPARFADSAHSFHEASILCRAAENTCYVASVNCASPGAVMTSAIVRPDGTLLAHQPHAVPGLLVADIDIDAATGLLARRLRRTAETA